MLLFVAVGYGRLDLNDRLSVWGLAGYGTGELTLTEKGKIGTKRYTADIALRMGAAGTRGTLSLPFIPSIAETLEFCITTGYPFRHA